MKQKGLHITIGSVPLVDNSGSAPKVDMVNELRMVKAALLYADRAKLCSVSSSVLMDIISFEELPTHKRVDFLETLSLSVPKYQDSYFIREVLGEYKQARSRRYSKKGRARLKEFEKELEEYWEQGKAAINAYVEDAGGYGLLRAVDAGLLEIHPFTDTSGLIARLMPENENTRQVTWDYIAAISETVTDISTYPLFDELTSDLIRSAIKDGIIPVSDNTIARSKETGLAAELLRRLPLFDEASIDEILDVRQELERPLVRFRSAMISFSEKISEAAWDTNFPFDAEQVFNRDVAPAILNIEDEVKANSYLKELARKWFDKPLLLTGGSALALAVSNLPIPSIAALSLGITANTVAALYDTNKEWRAKQRAIEQNNMFFYYRAGEMLSEEGK